MSSRFWKKINIFLVGLLAVGLILTSLGSLAPSGNSQDYFFEIAKGNRPGHKLLAKFGENPNIQTGGPETIWDGGGVYAPPTAARIHNIVSSLAADAGQIISSGNATGGSLISLEDDFATFQVDGVAIGDFLLNDENVELGVVTGIVSESELALVRAMRDPELGLDGQANEFNDAYRVVRDNGAGASILYLFGHSPAFLEQREFVVLNGLTDVPTEKSYIRQQRARVFASASSGALGLITSTTIGETVETVSLQIINGNNQTMMALATIPINKIGLVTRWYAQVSKKQSISSIVDLRIGQLDLNKPGYITQRRSLQTLGTSAFDHKFSPALVLPGGSDIWIEADTDSNGTGIAAGFDIIIINVLE